jgi:AcrR family transcriptional regulator
MPHPLRSATRPGSTQRRPSRRYTPRLPRAERRELILDAALRLVADEGWTALTINRVAAEAEIAKSVLYAIFDTPGGLEHALLSRERQRAFQLSARTLEQLGDAENPLAAISNALAVWLAGVTAAPHTWRLVLMPIQSAPPAVREAILEGREQWRRRLEPILADLLGGDRAAGLDLEIAAHLIRGNAEYLAQLALENPGTFTPQRIQEFAVRVVALLATRDHTRRLP